MQIEEEYLGDGVYASYDGWHIKLDLRMQDPGDIVIALEPAVLRRFTEYLEYVASANQENSRGKRQNR